jgi:hypothetical protein
MAKGELLSTDRFLRPDFCRRFLIRTIDRAGFRALGKPITHDLGVQTANPSRGHFMNQSFFLRLPYPYPAEAGWFRCRGRVRPFFDRARGQDPTAPFAAGRQRAKAKDDQAGIA